MMKRVFRNLPNSGGWWEWYEGVESRGECFDVAPELLLLCAGGTEVVEDDEWSKTTGRVVEHNGFWSNYWEATQTDSENMPGMWRKASRRAVRKHIKTLALSLPALSVTGRRVKP